MHQHALGPYPIDPNLIAQGVPPDDRAGRDSNTYGPLQGTPMPADGTPPVEPPPGAVEPSPSPFPVPPVPGEPSVAPSAFDRQGVAGPSVAFATYDPKTGQYAAPDGKVYRQSDLATHAGPRSWKDLLPG
jgi:phospholipid/cholesterol/gamma-HCH transport system substrate-binding protein